MVMEKNNKQGFNHSLKRIAKTSFIVFTGIILSKILAYLYRIVIARDFGPEIYGIFSLAVVLAGVFSIFASLGLDEGILRFVSFYRGKNEKNKIQQVIRFSLKIMFFTSIFSGLILFFLSGAISKEVFHNNNLIIFLKWFSLFIPVFIISGIFWSALKAYEEIGWYSFLSYILQNFLQLAVLLFLIFLNFKEKSVVFSYTIGFLILFVVSFLVCKYKIPEIFHKPRINIKTRKEVNKELFAYSWPMMFMGAMLSIYTWIDSLTIGYFKDMSQIGIYNAAVPIATFLGLVPALFISLFFPLVTKEFSRKNFKLIKDLSQQIGKWIFILNLPLVIILVFFPGAVINLLFGQGFMGAAGALRFLAIGTFFFSIFSVSNTLLSMVGKSKTILVNIIVISIINLLLNIILVPKYGIEGAAFSTMLSYILWGLITLFQARKYTSIVPLKRKMFRVFFIMIIPASILFLIKQFIPINLFTMLVQGTLFLLLYLILILATGCLDKNDIMILNFIKKRVTGTKIINRNITT